ncbi:protein lin-9 homolog isoform X2 [Atheta coriaria]
MKTEPIKEEAMSEEEDQPDEVELGPAMLGLQRVGTTTPKTTPTQPTQVLNARGMPARIRKKNKMFYDDGLVNTPHHRVPSAKKQKMTPIKRTPKTPQSPYRGRTTERMEKSKKKQLSPVPLQSPDRKIGQKIGLRLRNLLKLPKAHKWVCFEWFYSNIDKCLFSGDNDFMICLKESFPELITRDLTRIEWTKIRRMMGRPRRCSQAFFNQERLDLEKKRNKIRALQQRKVTDLSTFQDLPLEIPMQLTIGTKVTARLRKPQDGLFTGSIDGVDTSNSTYRITFDRVGLGTHSVPDFEVLSNEAPDSMPLMNMPRRNGNVGYHKSNAQFTYSNSGKLRRDRDPLLASYMLNRPVMPGVKQGYPVELLEKMVLVRKILGAKRLKINLLKTMNQEAERLLSDQMEIPEDLERRYAGILIDLEKLNKDLQANLDEMQTFLQDIAHDSRVVAMLTPSHLREKCKEEASDIVSRSVQSDESSPVESDSVRDLITDLTALMLQVKCLSDSDQNVFELQVLEGTMENIKRKLSPENQAIFQMNVECHMKHIQFGLTQPQGKMK